MKRTILFFAVCLGLFTSWTTWADDVETARAASKRTTSTVVSTNNANRSVTTDNKKTESQTNKNARTATKSTQQRNVVNRTPVANVKPRTPIVQPTKQNQSNVVKRVSTQSRGATTTRKPTANISDTVTRAAVSNAGKKRNVRAAELDTQKIENIKSANYSKCKTVYYECMDEFCANKDTNLRRCACSSRIHEFDGIKKQLNDAEDKMLDFNQRLLTVGLDKEDAAAINVATDGELAFYDNKDTSESEKLLQKITKTLNSSGDSKINNDLSSISLSLDMDTAWDDVDSLSGIATTAKDGLELYNAAHPICIEMAKEVCSDDELQIAQNGYKLTIQQDCETVAKSYKTLYNNAMDKIHESGALLDMSRLNIYQQRNSDDTLTCKKKILTQLSDASVCGENLYKCLDMTGKYIDPSTGKAFLSSDLSELKNLLQEPVGDEKWSKITKNESFVKFLNNKKAFLEPAIAQCQDVSDMVWKDFLDDALSQIKLAQNAKIEEIKQNCTTLIADCKTSALKDLANFDSRALSMFSVAADKTANEMCANIQNSCIALMEDSADWETGITGIATDITYDAIVDTCGQIGRDCIIEHCNGTTGNFALCKSIISDNRIAVLERSVCWDKVVNCVNGADNLNNFNITSDYLYHSCKDGVNSNACLIANKIWGKCSGEDIPTSKIDKTDDSTLLSWFAVNTSTDSCNSTGCPAGYKKIGNICHPIVSETTNDCGRAESKNEIVNVILNALTNYCANGKRDQFGNCCADGFVNNGVCVTKSNENARLLLTVKCSDTCDANDDACEQAKSYYCPQHNASNPRQISLYCITTGGINQNDNEFECTGRWVMIDQYGNYFDAAGIKTDNNTRNFVINGTDTNNNNATNSDMPTNVAPQPNVAPQTNVAPQMGYRTAKNPCANTEPNGMECIYEYDDDDGWKFTNCTEISTPIPTDNEFIIKY